MLFASLHAISVALHAYQIEVCCLQGISPLAKKRAPLNSRSLMKITSAAQLSAHFPAKERRSTRAREIFLALT